MNCLLVAALSPDTAECEYLRGSEDRHSNADSLGAHEGVFQCFNWGGDGGYGYGVFPSVWWEISYNSLSQNHCMFVQTYTQYYLAQPFAARLFTQQFALLDEVPTGQLKSRYRYKAQGKDKQNYLFN